ncbi:hypothetical protein PYR77_02810 [Acinetobacter soli]|nr:hypothetical protein [Acinetobacter soli]WEH92408.1 hypothetical protein PYR75_03230 [Acinetobacter soli]WEH98422.1 hypothetical protein PYR76_05205 [Acinetobacter soli]WEI00987.1 hypothetical protein PYR77_02810 [Acinetobacter soli]
MSELPAANAFVGSHVTEAEFKTAFSALLDFLKELATDVSANQGGAYSFTTKSNFENNKDSVPANSIVEISSGEDAGKYNWDGITLTKSDYDPVSQANNYTDDLSKKDNEQMNYLIEKINSIIKTFNLNSHNLNTGEKIWLSIQDKFLRSVFSIGEKTCNGTV